MDENIIKIPLLSGKKFSLSILLTILFIGLSYSSFSIEKEYVERLTNENKVLSSPLEFHIKTSRTALLNSTVNIEHEDAWLFFDNIRPAEVLSDYRTSIFINGEVLNNGANGRVAIYGHGTVILPHGYSFKPLTVYTGENNQGDSLRLILQTYHNNLDEFDNSVKSFRLKRGYMATFANNADGTGYSRVFIADNEDLVMNVLPDELYNTVSFIRVFKHEWVSKKGWCGWNANEIQMANVTCYYDWNVGGTTTTNYEYSPIRQNGGWPSWGDINAKQNVSHLLGFNEPDRPDQANMQFQDMIDLWPEMMKSGLRIGSPAWSNPWGGNGGNLFDFINKCDELNYRVDFVALHCYWGGKSPQSWYNDLKYIHEQTGRPLWITEWNNGANWTNEWWPDGRGYNEANANKQLNDLKGILNVLDTASFIERYFIYNWVEDCRAIILNGELTLAGDYYAQNQSTIAFNSDKEVIPHWNYKNPELSIRYFTLRNSIRVSWEDPNGELSRKYILEKKIDDGIFETIFTTEDSSNEFYLDPLDPELYGEVTYRLKLLTANGAYLYSNLETYYQTSGENVLQTGNFHINSFDVNTSYFSKRYSANPIIILGAPGFNNTVSMTQLVNGISRTSYNFYFFPWSYQNNPEISEPEILANLALPEGTLDFGGLKSEAGKLSGVTREWTSVMFNESFDEPPAVFCTLASGNNFYPLTIAIRNVTANGFEMRLKSEEAVTALLSPETVNYLAIEPGTGKVDGKRFMVGRNYSGSKIASAPIEISYDSTYSEPAVFANLLSDEDIFASTLRYSKTGNSKLELTKQREYSGNEAEIKADDFAWMIMDIATNQDEIGTATAQTLHQQEFTFYPNPAKNKVYLNLKKPGIVKIIDMSGRIVLMSTTQYEMDISSLNPGIYLLIAEGKLPVNLIKIK